jgi:hypothetical protein
MKNFLHGVGKVVAYAAVMFVGMATLIALGYLLGAILSVHDRESASTSGVCTSTLCQ